MLAFTDASGNPVSSYVTNSGVYISLTDLIQNTNANTVQTVTVNGHQPFRRGRGIGGAHRDGDQHRNLSQHEPVADVHHERHQQDSTARSTRWRATSCR